MFEFLQNLDKTTIICIVLLIIIIIALIVCVVKKLFFKDDNFDNSNNNKENLLPVELPVKMETKHNKNSNVDPEPLEPLRNNEEINTNSLTILFFDRVGCPYSDKQRAELEKNNMMIGEFSVKIISITSEEGQSLANQYGARGTPTLVNPQNGSKSVGFKPFDEHIKELTTVKEKIQLESDTLHIVGKQQCPFCVKMYKLCEENGIQYNSIDSNSDLGMKLLEQYESNGVPLIIRNNEYLIGFVELETLKQKLF